MSKSHTVRAGLGPVSVLHGMFGSLSIKEKNQDSVLYQIPILHHRQRAEEAQEGRVPGKQATKQEGQRYYGIILALREETETLRYRVSRGWGRQRPGTRR